MNIIYKINEEKKTVACIMETSPWDLFNEISTMFVKEKRTSVAAAINPEAFKIEGRYVGVARCCDADTFNIETGKKIAYNKAMKKMAKVRINYFKKIQKEFAGLYADVAYRLNEAQFYNGTLYEHFSKELL